MSQPEALALANTRRRRAAAKRFKALFAMTTSEEQHQLTYIEKQLADASRDPLDMGCLVERKAQILRPYIARLGSAS